MNKIFGFAAAFGLFLLGVSSAHAFVIELGDTKNGTAVSATVEVSVSSGNSVSDYRVRFAVTNTDDGRTDRITGLGADVLAGATIKRVDDPSDWGHEQNGTLPGNTMFDVCWYARNNCGAGGPSGIEDGETLGGFAIWFDGDFGSPGSLEAALYAGYMDGSLGLCTRHISIGSSDYSDVACQGEIVPEPGALALLGLSLLGFGLARLRRIN